jgi:hypothetical protein
MNSEWRKSSYSGGSSNQCVECGADASGVLVRDTVNRDGFTLSVSAAAWKKFTSTIK